MQEGRWEAGPQPEAPFAGSPTEGEALSLWCPVLPGGRESAGGPHVPGPPAQGGKGQERGWEGPSCVCARWETGNSGANVREKQLQSVRCGAGGALNAELGRVRPPLGLARRSGRAAVRGGIGEGQASH